MRSKAANTEPKRESEKEKDNGREVKEEKIRVRVKERIYTREKKICLRGG